MLVVLGRPDFRIVHKSIQGNHLHLIVEAESAIALARGLQAFQISAARKLNVAERRSRRGKVRRGPVFVDRYHAEIISTPTQARHAMAYVLNNWRRHSEDRRQWAQHWPIDPYSSAESFPGWAEGPQRELYMGFEPLPVSRPQSWLLAEGWKRVGPIRLGMVPGGRTGPHE
jgi:hypothetical protein